MAVLLFLSPGCGCTVSTSAAFAPILLPHELELNVGVGIGVTFLTAIRAVRLHLRGNDGRRGKNECDLHPVPPPPTGGARRLSASSRSREWEPLNSTSRSWPRLPACRRENRRSRL